MGLTKDLEERLKRHNSGRERATKHYKPFILIHTKLFGGRNVARNYEKFLKIRSNKEKIINAEVAELADAQR